MTLYVSGMLIRAFALRGLIFGFAVTVGLAERWLDPDSPEWQTMVSASVSTLALCLALGGAGGRGKQCPCGRGTACGQALILAGAEAGVAKTRPAALHNLGHAAGRAGRAGRPPHRRHWLRHLARLDVWRRPWPPGGAQSGWRPKVRRRQLPQRPGADAGRACGASAEDWGRRAHAAHLVA